MKKFWNEMFLREVPSLGLSFFRISVAITVGCHVIPSFFALHDNYLSTALRILDYSFVYPELVDLIAKSPDPFIVAMTAVFCLAWFFFLVGFLTQISCIVMTLGCYYFWILNPFVIDTLSWEILLVTLFLMCLTPYAGDYFSVDSMISRYPFSYRRLRPIFIQRLLQLQIAFTFFYTALYKCPPVGNWLTDNPLYYVMNYPAEGVTKYFILRDFMAARPQLCYAAGIFVVITEFFMPFLLFNPRTRRSAIYLGFIFHVTLILTLDVPAIFFFLFPAQMLLFIHPDDLVRWVEKKRKFYKESPSLKVVYDGHCQFCRASVEALKVADLWGRLTFIDYQEWGEISSLHPQLTRDVAHSQMHLIDYDGNLSGGFFAFRRMALVLPTLYLLVPLVYLPGMDGIGPLVYSWIAKNRYLFHFHKKCVNNACFR